jgi:hypothetical protein
MSPRTTILESLDSLGRIELLWLTFYHSMSCVAMVLLFYILSAVMAPSPDGLCGRKQRKIVNETAVKRSGAHSAPETNSEVPNEPACCRHLRRLPGVNYTVGARQKTSLVKRASSETAISAGTQAVVSVTFISTCKSNDSQRLKL